MPWSASPPFFTLEYCPPFSRFLSFYATLYLSGSLPHSSLSGHFKMEIDHISPLLKTPKGSLNSSKQAPYGMATTTPSLITCSSPLGSLCSSRTGHLVLPSMHQGNLNASCCLWLESSYLPDSHHLSRVLFSSQLSPRPLLATLVATTTWPPALLKEPDSPCSSSSIDRADDVFIMLIVYYLSPSARSLAAWRNESLSWLFTSVSQVFRAVALNIC